MLFKISLRNIRRSIKDYTIYFFTLVIGVSIFYVFNAINTQTAMLQMQESQRKIIELLQETLSATSVFVAVVLAMLIVYASRFLMKRRHREFAVYMTLGMSKGQVSAMLFLETVLIGVVSLVVGLLIGTVFSQLTSAIVVDMFEADMTDYKFIFSQESAIKTVVYFAIMYVAVIILNNFAVSKMKLIDLIQSSKKTERIPNRNIFLCIILFTLAVLGLGYAYHQVGWSYSTLNEEKLLVCIAIGGLCTFLIFWSMAGIALKLIMSRKKLYYRGINAFTFRQVSSMINTMVIAMTIICLMLFLTICAISSSFAVRNSMNGNLKSMCPADVEINVGNMNGSREPITGYSGELSSIRDLYKDYGYDITDEFSDYVEVNSYLSPELTMRTSFGPYIAEIQKSYMMLDYDSMEEIMSLSDYNRLMKFYGKDGIELNDDEYAVICNFQSMKAIRDSVMATGNEVEVFGYELKPAYKECIDSSVEIAASHINSGVYIVPDSVVENQSPEKSYFFGNYKTNSKADIDKYEADQQDRYEHIWDDLSDTSVVNYFYIETRAELNAGAVGLGAILAFLGLYIGLVFMLASGAVLSLKCMSESVDSVERYVILRKIGVEERDLSKSIFTQVGLLFLAPLVLAIIHSAAGMKFATYLLETFGTDEMWHSIGISCIILAVIYGGYFVITYLNSRNIDHMI